MLSAGMRASQELGFIRYDPPRHDDHRMMLTKYFTVAGVKEQIGTEESSSCFFKEYASVPAVRNMRG
jgi:hypothetical protein